MIWLMLPADIVKAGQLPLSLFKLRSLQLPHFRHRR
jgi:hypothetical protein